MTPPPVDEYGLETRDLLRGTTGVTRTAEHTKKYAQACIEAGQEAAVPVLDLWSAMMTRAGWKKGDQVLPGSKSAPPNTILSEMLLDGRRTVLLPDVSTTYVHATGLHFSPSGYKILFAETMEIIETIWPYLSPSSIPDRFPYYMDAPR